MRRNSLLQIYPTELTFLQMSEEVSMLGVEPRTCGLNCQCSAYWTTWTGNRLTQFTQRNFLAIASCLLSQTSQQNKPLLIELSKTMGTHIYFFHPINHAGRKIYHTNSHFPYLVQKLVWVNCVGLLSVQVDQ